MDERSKNSNDHYLILPPFGKTSKLSMDMSAVNESISRLVDSKTVNPVTYPELSHCYNEGYRMLKQHLATVEYQLLLADKALETAKADVILGEYASFLEGKPKTTGNTDLRNAFLIRNKEYSESLDRINQLKALQANFEGKVKTLENVNKFINQQMYLISRSGLGNTDLYITSGKRDRHE